ncbi:MAG: DUF1801 domain-containing protein [Rhodothermales bacterium]|nr:DUF1801 domain-containing protein [Rhodothermales bacterium]
MAALKTAPTDANVEAFLATVEDDARRADCYTVLELMRRVTGEPPTMWGDSIVGFGSYHYVYDSGREGDWFLAGFSPRKRNLTLYVMAGFDRYEALLERLGKYKTGKSCLYVNRLDDVDLGVLEELVRRSVEHVRAAHA